MEQNVAGSFWNKPREVVLSARELGYVKRYSIIGNAECFPES
ncbi:hypothetical protein VULLAG_LOCUS21903 [Vulpes lagopus]